MNLETPEAAGGARMLEAMIEGKHVGRLDLHVVGDKLGASPIAASARRCRPSWPTTAPARPTTPARCGEHRSGARCATTTSSAASEIDEAIARETARLRALPAADQGELVREPDHPARRDDARPPGRRPAGRRLQPREPAARRRRQAGRAAAPSAPRPRRRPRRRRAARGPPARRATPAPSRAAAATQPALALLADDQARARAGRADEAEARPRSRPASAATSPASCGRAAPGDIARARGRLRDVGCEACHGAGQHHSRRRPPTSSGASAARSPRRLPRLPHARPDQRRVRLQDLPEGDPGPGPRWRPPARASSIVAAPDDDLTALALALALFGPAPAPAAGAAAPAPAPRPPRPPLTPDRPHPPRLPARKRPRPRPRRPPAPAAPATAAGDSFETLGAAAVRTRDIGDAAGVVRRPLRRREARHRSRPLPGHAGVPAPDAAATDVLVHDRRSGRHRRLGLRRRGQGLPRRAAGLRRLHKPVTIGGSGEPRLVTLKVPDKDADSLMKAVVDVTQHVRLRRLAEAKRWLDAERPFLRAEFLFRRRPRARTGTFGASRGFALKLLGGRVYNRCTGESCCRSRRRRAMAERPPPATRIRPAPPRPRAATEAATPPPANDDLPRAAHARRRSPIRWRRSGPQVFACYQQHQVARHAAADLRVASNGTVQSVAVGPASPGRRPACACSRRRRTRASRPSSSTSRSSPTRSSCASSRSAPQARCATIVFQAAALSRSARERLRALSTPPSSGARSTSASCWHTTDSNSRRAASAGSRAPDR